MQKSAKIKEAIIMKIVPLFDKVVVEPVESEETTKSGFILPSASQEKQQLAKVIAVGPGGELDGKEVTIIRQSDILAVVE